MSGVDLAGIGSLLSVLTGLFVTVGGLMLQRQRRQAVDADDIEQELEVRTRQFNIAMRFIRRHEEDRAAFTDLAPLPRPRQLRAGWFQREISQGKRRRPRDDAADGADEQPDEDSDVDEPDRAPRRYDGPPARRGRPGGTGQPPDGRGRRHASP